MSEELPDFLEIPKVRGFKMVSFNIVSLLKYIDEFRIWLSYQKVDLIVINESRLDENINDTEVQLDKYNLIRKYRNRNGGGVCVYVNTNFDYKVRDDLMLDTAEFIVIEVNKLNTFCRSRCLSTPRV